MPFYIHYDFVVPFIPFDEASYLTILEGKMWITPKLVTSSKKSEEWMEIQKSEIFSLQHLENLSDEVDNPLQAIQFTSSPMKFSYRIVLNTSKGNFCICIGKNFHSILKDWEWVKDSTKSIVEEMESVKNVDGKRKIKTRLEQTLIKQFETLGKQSSLEIEKKKGGSVFENFTRVLSDKFDELISPKKENTKKEPPSLAFTKDMLLEVLRTGTTFFLQFHLVEGIEHQQLLFWLEIDNYKKLGDNLEERKASAMCIFEKYLQRNTYLGFEVDPCIVPSKEDLSQPSPNIFDPLSNFLLDIMFVVTFPRFLDSSMYAKYHSKMKPENAEPSDNTIAGLEKTITNYFVKTFHIKSDELVGYCGCVLKRSKESRTGGLYISVNHISFYSPANNSDEQVIKLMIPFASISYITKTKDKILLDILPPSHEDFVKSENSIRIGFKGKEFLFCNFSSPKETYILLNQLWTMEIDSAIYLLQPSSRRRYSITFEEKKLSDFLSLSPTVKGALDMKQQNADFHRIFRVPMEETLEKRAPCSLIVGTRETGDDEHSNRKVIRGTIMLSMQYLCFKSTKKSESEILLVIPFEKTAIVGIERRSSDIPNMIFIKTLTYTCFFAFQDENVMHDHFYFIRKSWGKYSPSSPAHLSMSFQDWKRASLEEKQRMGDQADPVYAISKNKVVDEISREKSEKFSAMLPEIGELESLDDNEYGNLFLKNKNLRNQVRFKGIPQELRGKFWLLWSGARFKLNLWPGHYQELLSYYSKQTSTAIEDIEKDLHRTFPEHPFYQKREGIDALRRVLTSYSWRNQAIGYCQSMNMVCGVMLLFMTEEETFWMTAQVCEELLKDYYTPSIMGAVVDQRVFEVLVGKFMPDVLAHLEKVGIPVNMISLPWFMCLFCTCFQVDITIRILDCFFYEGRTVFFKIGLALFKLKREEILKDGDMARILNDMKKLSLDPDLVLDTAFRYFDDIPLSVIDELTSTFRCETVKERSTENLQMNLNTTNSMKQKLISGQASWHRLWFPKKEKRPSDEFQQAPVSKARTAPRPSLFGIEDFMLENTKKEKEMNSPPQ